MAECVCGDPNGRPGECPVHHRLPWMPPAEVWQPAGYEELVDPPSFASGGVLPTLPPGLSYPGLLVELEPCGYRLSRDAAESLGRSGEVLRALNDAGVSMAGGDAAHEAIAREVSRRAEAGARAWLVGRVRAELQSRLDGVFMDPSDDESMGRAAEVAADVFVEFLRNPPAMVTDADGVTRVEQR